VSAGGVGIVGGGISGLALGRALAARGVPVRIFEADEVPGGVIRSVSASGRTLELGPQRVRPSDELLPLLRLIPGWRVATGDTGGGDAGAIHPRRVWIGRRGTLHPVPRTLVEGLTSRLLSPAGKFRLALEPFVANPSDGAGASAADYLRHRLGSEAYEALVGPLFGGLYGSDPEAVDADRVLLPALVELGAGRSLLAALATRRGSGLLSRPPVVPPGGMAALPAALAGTLGDRVSLGNPVKALEPSGPGGSGESGWTLHTARGSFDLDAVVLTLPPDRASELLGPVDAEAAARLGKLRMNPLALVHLDVDPLPPGLGFQVAFGEGGRLRGMTFSGHLDGSGTTAVAFLGGMAEPGAVELDDPILASIAAAEARGWTGSRVRPLHVSRTRMPAWDRSFRALDGLSLPPGIHLHANYVGRPGIIGRVREAERLASRLALHFAGTQAHAGSAARGSPFTA
jgi:protoporphyrinogen/coproporphyrinogen III oxidase